MTRKPLVVALVGAECTGKTTLAAGLAASNRGRMVPEYLRQFVDSNGRTPVADEQLSIMRSQIELERVAIEGARSAGEDLVVADPAALMTAVYSIAYFDDPSLVDEAVAHQGAYDLTLWCDRDLPWVADGDQRDGPEYRDQVHDIIASIVATNDLYVELLGGFAEVRLARASELIAQA